MKNPKKKYKAPSLTVVSFKSEQGFAISNEFLVGGFTPDFETIEVRDNSGGYFGGGDENSWF